MQPSCSTATPPTTTASPTSPSALAFFVEALITSLRITIGPDRRCHDFAVELFRNHNKTLPVADRSNCGDAFLHQFHNADAAIGHLLHVKGCAWPKQFG